MHTVHLTQMRVTSYSKPEQSLQSACGRSSVFTDEQWEPAVCGTCTIYLTNAFHKNLMIFLAYHRQQVAPSFRTKNGDIFFQKSLLGKEYQTRCKVGYTQYKAYTSQSNLLIWMMCPSSTPLSFMDWTACIVQTLRPSTFTSNIFFNSSVDPPRKGRNNLPYVRVSDVPMLLMVGWIA